jgi:hypothetical protein
MKKLVRMNARTLTNFCSSSLFRLEERSCSAIQFLVVQLLWAPLAEKMRSCCSVHPPLGVNNI